MSDRSENKNPNTDEPNISISNGSTSSKYASCVSNDPEYYNGQSIMATQEQPEVGWQESILVNESCSDTPKASRMTNEKRVSNSPMLYRPEKRRLIKSEESEKEKLDKLRLRLMEFRKKEEDSTQKLLEEEVVETVEKKTSIEIIDLPDDITSGFDESFDCEDDFSNNNSDCTKTVDINVKADDKCSKIGSNDRNLSSKSVTDVMINQCSQGVDKVLRVSPPTSDNQPKPGTNNAKSNFDLKTYSKTTSNNHLARIKPGTKLDCSNSKMIRHTSDPAIQRRHVETPKKVNNIEDYLSKFHDEDPNDKIFAESPVYLPQKLPSTTSKISSLWSKDSGKLSNLSTVSSNSNLSNSRSSNNISPQINPSTSSNTAPKRFFKSKSITDDSAMDKKSSPFWRDNSMSRVSINQSIAPENQPNNYKQTIENSSKVAEEDNKIQENATSNSASQNRWYSQEEIEKKRLEAQKKLQEKQKQKKSSVNCSNVIQR